MNTTKTFTLNVAFFALALALGCVFGGGCKPSPEERERAEEEKLRAEAAAAVRPEAMSLAWIPAGAEAPSGEFDTASLAGKPWLLLAFRAGDAPCRDAVPEWNSLAEQLSQRGCGLLAVDTDFGSGNDEAARQDLAAAASFPVCGASRAQLDALESIAPMPVNPVAYLFDAEGRCVRATAGFVRPEHHVEDVEALLAGLELPEHPAQGVLPEENEP